MRTRAFFALSVLIFIDVCYSIFEWNQTCVPNGCTLTCQKNQLNLQSVVLFGSTNQRYFAKKLVDGTLYYITIPLCGAYSAVLPLDFSKASIFQTSPDGLKTVSLGLYTPNSTITSWTLGYCGDDVAISATFYNGTYCLETGTYRQTTLYLMCDPRYNARYAAIMVLEPTTCHFAIQMSMIEICNYFPSDATPVLAPTLSPAVTRSPANYYAASTSCIDEPIIPRDVTNQSSIAGEVVALVVGIGFLFTVVYCVYKRIKMGGINRESELPIAVMDNVDSNNRSYVTSPVIGDVADVSSVAISNNSNVSTSIRQRDTLPTVYTGYSGAYISVPTIDHSKDYGGSDLAFAQIVPEPVGDISSSVEVAPMAADRIVYAEAV